MAAAAAAGDPYAGMQQALGYQHHSHQHQTVHQPHQVLHQTPADESGAMVVAAAAAAAVTVNHQGSSTDNQLDAWYGRGLLRHVT